MRIPGITSNEVRQGKNSGRKKAKKGRPPCAYLSRAHAGAADKKKRKEEKNHISPRAGPDRIMGKRSMDELMDGTTRTDVSPCWDAEDPSLTGESGKVGGELE